MIPPDVPDQEKKIIYHQTAKLNEYLREYFCRYPVFDPVRFPATSLTSAFENPALPLEVLQQIVKVPVWIFTIDAVIDEKILPEPVLTEQLIRYEQVVIGKNVEIDHHDQYGQVLLDIRNSLQQKPLFGELRNLWEETYIKMIRGMLFESAGWSIEQDITIDAYLEHGLYSIGVPTYVVSTWILQSSGDQINLPCRPGLESMMRLSAICIRLANDLRTFEKEQTENNLNAIILKERAFRAQGFNPTDAREMAFREIEGLLERYMHEFSALTDDQEPLKKSLRRLTDFSISFYSKHDFHTVSLHQINTSGR